MKSVVLAFAMIASASVATLGQGQFVFNNWVPPEINARFVLGIDTVGTSSVGTNYTVELFNYTGSGEYIPLVPPSAPLRGPAGTVDAGYVVPTAETVLATAPGERANIVIRVSCPWGAHQDFGPYAVTLGGGNVPLPNLSIGTSPLTAFCWAPLQATLDNPGFMSWGDFGFGAKATGWNLLIIEASSNLVAWVPVKTNWAFATPIPFGFADSESTNYSRRFYRARLH